MVEALGAQSTLRITVCVLTYRRPVDLAILLPLLDVQAAQSEASDVEILVVDNDPDAGARPAVMAAADAMATPVRYEHEPRPGISAARNHALDACAWRDVLVFIDDDERPSNGWLAHHLRTWRIYGSTTVNGPVVSEYEVEPEPWITAGGFFRRRRMPTGSLIEMGGTGNLLIDLEAVRRLGVRFDEAFGTTGGEDSLFTLQIHRRGGRLVWCDEAIVTDVVPRGRLTRRWVVLRVLRYGTSWSRTHLAVEPRRAARAGLRFRFTAEGLLRVVVGAGRGAFGLVSRQQQHQARGVKVAARGLGMVTGAWGWHYEEYRRNTEQAG